MRRRRFMVSAVVLAALGAVAVTGAAARADEQGTYVALGDSYASGVGAGPYEDGACLRSVGRSYPARWAAGHAGGAQQLGLVDRTCAGATIDTVRRDQLAALDARTRWVTVTVGGNDAGFSSTLQQCLQGGDAACHSAARTSIGTMTTRLPGALDGLYGEIRGRAPNARVVVVGYPHLVSRPGAGPACGPLSDGKRGSLNAAADTLAEVIRNRAARHSGFTFVDGRAVFAGHEACSAEPWIHALAQNAAESFHPTADGHQAYADALLAATR